MLFWRRPMEAAIRAFLENQAGYDLTYSAVGGTITNPPLSVTVSPKDQAAFLQEIAQALQELH